MTKSPTNRLRVVRAERDITQHDIARKAHMSQTKYWRIENGYDTPTDDQRKAFAKILRVTEADLWPTLEVQAAS